MIYKLNRKTVSMLWIENEKNDYSNSNIVKLFTVVYYSCITCGKAFCRSSDSHKLHYSIYLIFKIIQVSIRSIPFPQKFPFPLHLKEQQAIQQNH